VGTTVSVFHQRLHQCGAINTSFFATRNVQLP